MWFKQIQIFQLNSSIDFSPNSLMKKLEELHFRPCLPSMESSQGWISPINSEDEYAPLIRSINGFIMICLQIEEKILPNMVIRYELEKKIRKIEIEENRKLRQNEKLSLKDELIVTLLPRAFSKFTKYYAYLDTHHNRLVLGTTNPKKTDHFIEMFKKTITESISPIETKKLSPVITQWIKNNDYPSAFAIEKACVLQDPNQQGRVIRCQQQDLFTTSIQSLIMDGCAVKQLAINWQDRISFVLSDDFSIKSMKFQDEVKEQTSDMEIETKEQQFDADFLIMTGTLSLFIEDLLSVFQTSKMVEKNVEYAKTA